MEQTEFHLDVWRVDLCGERIEPVALHIRNGRIHRIEPIPAAKANGFAIPGFVDAHVHIESSMLMPTEFARVAVTHGTVATVSDPHEIANVCGIEGVELMLANAAKSPLKFHFGAPSCVPATQFETAGAQLGVADVERLLDDPRINHLSEMMNFPGVLSGDLEVMSKITAARSRGMPIDGHAPGLRGSQVARYFGAGISTDHECVDIDEARDKIACGAKIAIREGSAARNFEALSPLIREAPESCLFCSDDKHPDDLLRGHVNELVRRAVANGADPMRVLSIASLNPVRHYGLDVGLLQEGDPADFVIVRDLKQFEILRTYIDGLLVAEGGKSLIETQPPERLNRFHCSRLQLSDLSVPAEGKQIRVIEVWEGQIVTGQSTSQIAPGTPEVDSCVEDDVLKLVVVNRYKNARPAIAFVRGFGLQRGALASSVAHDSHNIVAVGVEDEDLLAAINAIVDAQGGLAASSAGKTECLPLPIAGLMSAGSCAEVGKSYANLGCLSQSYGCELAAPFMTLSFLSLPVIPALKLTDLGLFDVEQFAHVPLFCECEYEPARPLL